MVSPVRAQELRILVHQFVAEAGGRRRLPRVVHLGRMGTAVIAIPDLDDDDPGLRADVVARAVECLDCADPIAWLTRGGESEPRGADVAWAVAVTTAFARFGLAAPACYLITRTGWVDLLTGEERRWVRVRPQRQRAG